MVGQHLHDIERRSCTVCTNVLKYILLGRVKTALSLSASSKSIRCTGAELWPRYIWWSIIGGVRYSYHELSTSINII